MLKKKESIMLISIFSIIIIIFGLIFLRLYARAPQIKEHPGISDSDYEMLYQEEFEKCMNEPWIYQCMAQVTGNLSFCNRWIEAENDIVHKSACIDGYMLHKAITLEKGNSCDKIKDTDFRRLCNAIKTREIIYCDLIENSSVMRGMCISILANRQACDEITGEDKEWCKEHLKFCSALIQNDIKMCESLELEENRVTCKALIANNPDICKQEPITSCEDKAELEALRRMDKMNLDIGANQRNVSYCKKIIDEDMKGCCISVVNNDPELCKQVKDERTKLFCIVQIAELQNNWDLCDELNSEMRKMCIEYHGGFF